MRSYFVQKFDKTVQFAQELSEIQEMRTKVFCSDLELLVNVDKSIAELKEQINEKKNYYTEEIEKQRNSNKTMEEIRLQRNKSSHIEKNPISQSQHGFFIHAKKIAGPIGAVAVAGIALAMMYRAS